jgi:hypothetical protein
MANQLTDIPAIQQRDSAPAEATPTRMADVLIGAGSIAILVVGVAGHASQGGAIAAGLFVVVVGLVIRYPTLLQDGSQTDSGTPAVSTMRVAVLLVVSIFAMLTIKAGWGTPGLDALKIDPSWAWILGAALGGKAAQSFAEAAPKGK